MRRRGAEEAKVVIQRIPNKQSKKKKKNSFRFPFTRRLDDDRLSPLKFCLLKKKILSLSLSLSVVLSSPPPHCVLKANNNTKR